MKKLLMLSIMLAMMLMFASPPLDKTIPSPLVRAILSSRLRRSVKMSRVAILGCCPIALSVATTAVFACRVSNSAPAGNDLNSFGLQPTQAGLFDPELAGLETEDGNLEQDVQCVPTITQESTATG